MLMEQVTFHHDTKSNSCSQAWRSSTGLLSPPAGSDCCASASPAASSFSFCRPAVEYRALPEDFKQQLGRRTGGNLTWHDGRGQKTAGGRTVKLLQQPGTDGFQVNALQVEMENSSPAEISSSFISLGDKVYLLLTETKKPFFFF